MRKVFKKGMSMVLTMVMVFTMVLGAGLYVSTDEADATSAGIYIDDLLILPAEAAADAPTYFYNDGGLL